MDSMDFVGFDKKDMLKNLHKEREKIIHDSSSQNINTSFNINKVAKELHPKVQYVKISEIIEETEDTKSFILVPNPESETKKLAYFKAGQYISVEIPIEGGLYRRTYNLSSSPKEALKNKYKITIKKEKNGIVSNYFFNSVEVGDTFTISAPSGEFCYERLRDANHIIAIAGGSGVTPFMSMIEAIYDGTLNCSMTLIYGIKTKKDIIFRKRLEEVSMKSKKIKVVYVLSEEIDTIYETGFIEKNLIDNYLEAENSFFICGPLALYEHMNTILKEYDLATKYIRHEMFMGEVEISKRETFNLTVITQEKEIVIPCRGSETLLTAMEKNGIKAPSRCHVGECGFCRSKLISGKVKAVDEAIRVADKNYNFVHPCASFPESDVVIKLPF